jgi:hypothetical protein
MKESIGAIALGVAFLLFGFWRLKELRMGSTDHFDKVTLSIEQRFVWLPFLLGSLAIILGIYLMVS